MAGWKLKAVSTDTASEFRSSEFRQTVEALGVGQRLIRAGRPLPTASSNEPSEQSWKSVGDRASPAPLRPSQQLSEETSISTSTTTTSTASHWRLTKGRPPGEVVYGSLKMRPR